MKIILSVILTITSFLSICKPVDPIPPKPPTQYALKFDGVNDWVDIGDNENFEFNKSDFTIEVWFKAYIQDDIQVIFRKGFNRPVWGEGRWVLSIDSTDVIRIVVEDNLTNLYLISTGSSIVTDGIWHHVAAVFDRDNALLVYLDGDLEIKDIGLLNYSGPIINDSKTNVYIGRNHIENKFFKGFITDIRTWGRSLSHGEIKGNMTKLFSGREVGLIAYYRMEEGEGQVLVDYACDNYGQLGSGFEKDENDPSWISLDNSIY